MQQYLSSRAGWRPPSPKEGTSEMAHIGNEGDAGRRDVDEVFLILLPQVDLVIWPGLALAVSTRFAGVPPTSSKTGGSGLQIASFLVMCTAGWLVLRQWNMQSEVLEVALDRRL